MRFPLQFSRLLAAVAALSWTQVSALDLSQLDAAEAELESLVADWQAEWNQRPIPATARELAVSLQALGMVERQAGKPAEALGHLTTACDLLTAHAPELVTDALEAKALTLQDLGDLVESEKLLRQVLAVRQQAAAGSKLAATLDHLALNLLYQGRYPEVAPLLDQAESATPADDADFRARLAAHRGRLYHTLGSHSRAASIFQRALELPFADRELRLSLKSQLALSQLRLGKIAEAREGTEAVAEEARELFAENQIRAVPYLNNLGAIALSQGEPEIAKSSFQEALRMLEASSGADHPGLIGPLNNLGVAEQALGDYPAARIHLERAAALQAKHLPATHLRVAETERNLAQNSLLSESPDAKDHIVRATRTALDLLDRLIREGTENERLNFLERFDLVSLPAATGDAELIADVLIATKARLLDAMLAAPESVTRPTWRDIQATLPPGSAFVDTCRFTTTTVPQSVSYGAIVILPSGPPKWVLLGTDESLEKWLGALHERLRWHSATLAGDTAPAPPLKIRGILRALGREFWEPLQIPPGTDHIAYSPDSRLHFLPLSALLDRENRPLSTRFLQITTVTSGRDLVDPAPAASLSGSPWTVLTISDFPKSPAIKDTADPLLSLLADLAPMPGTRIEAEKLRALAPRGSQFLSGSEASESSLRQLSDSPSVLHLGCHAFFLHTDNSALGMPIDFDEQSDLLFAGGLVLYEGARRDADSPRLADDDDLLFPSEIARLPLGQTRLVTLSSCESGAGTPVSGEGLLGLRRAFSLAGVREIVVALWPVSDDSTPGFMERFYQLALSSDRPAQALWQAQGEFLSKAPTDGDFELAVLRYAPFVLSQNSPLTVGPAIVASPLPAAPKMTWLVLLAGLPLLLFFISRFRVNQRKEKISRE
jgi:CHAT domain-containing protein/tetratricopeptide (TPR) repeat protein